MPTPQPIRAATQDHLDIEEITDNLVLLKDGSVAIILIATAVNFGLLSESEQDATIYAYAGLLNSLTFPIQIFIRSNRKDITGYEKLLTEQETKATKPENKERIRKYREFIGETVRQRNVLDKKFYISIPFFILELGVAKSASAITKKKEKGLPFKKEYILSRAKMTLEPKRDHLIHQLSRLGLKAQQLNTRELIQLLFDIYNTESSHGQNLASSEEYETPIVQPAVAFRESPQITIPQHSQTPEKTQTNDTATQTSEENINVKPEAMNNQSSAPNPLQPTTPPTPDITSNQKPDNVQQAQQAVDSATKPES